MGKQPLATRQEAFRRALAWVAPSVLRVPNQGGHARSRHARPSPAQLLDRGLSDHAVRVVGTALGATLLLAVGAASSRATQLEPVSRTASVQLSAEVAPSPIAAPLQARTIRTQPAVPPTVTPLARPRVNAQPVAVRRWLPTGTGMWLHEWARSEGGNGRAVVARAKRVGLSTLFVRTGSTHDGWTGTPTLRSLLPATRGTGIKVVAWDFPELVDPAADALRMARAARFSCPGCPRVAAVAPDVETAAEGTRIGEQTVARYYSTLRRALPRDVAILATVPWPSEMRTGHYPYARTASLVDALMPMAYWYNRSPAVVTATSMAYLRRFHKPVMPVGQGYDGRIDAPNLAADPDPGGSVRSFLRTAKRRGARSVSLWSWQTTGGQQWAALAGARGLFRPKLLTPRR